MIIWLADTDFNNFVSSKGPVEMAGLRLRILMSYHYYQKTNLSRLFEKHFKDNYPEVFADSGGFSAMTQGAQLDVKAYGRWLIENRDLITIAANLDVIGNVDQSAKNLAILEDMGLNVVPVFHVGSPFDVLEQMIEKYPYIALGGMVPHMRHHKKLMPWVIKCFKLAEGRSVFHGFGATAWNVISDVPWYSVDSSSWGRGFRYGQLPLYDERRGTFVIARLGDRRSVYRWAALIRELGYDPEDFADRARNQRAKICAVSALSYLKAERWLRKRHGEIVIPDRGDPSGLRTFLADTAIQNLSDAGTGLRMYLASTSDVSRRDAALGVKVFLADANPNATDFVNMVKEVGDKGSDDGGTVEA